MHTTAAPRPWLAVALAVFALVVVLALAAVPRRDLLVAAPTQAATEAPLPAPTPRQAPAVTAATASPGPPAPAQVYSSAVDVRFEADPADPWTSVRPWAREVFDGKTIDFTVGGCPASCGTAMRITVTVGALADGLIYGTKVEGSMASCPYRNYYDCVIWRSGRPAGRDVPLRVKGETTDDLAEAWMAVDGTAAASTLLVGADRWTILRFTSRLVALVAHGDSLVAVSIDLDTGLPASTRQTRFAGFLAGVQFDGPGTPISGSIGDLEVSAPSTWTIETKGTTLYLNYEGFLSSVRQQVSLLTAGDELKIVDRVSGVTGTFVISGRSLREVAASIDVGLGRASGTKQTIGGAMGYGWSFPETGQAASSAALTGLAILEWKDAFYVFQEHGANHYFSAGSFDFLLGSVTKQPG